MSKPGDIYAHAYAKKDRESPPQKGSLRVWWVPQIPGTPFHWRVNTLVEAAVLLDALASYDDFQFAQNVKGDYANAGGVEVLTERDGWESWESEDGEDFDEHRQEKGF